MSLRVIHLLDDGRLEGGGRRALAALQAVSGLCPELLGVVMAPPGAVHEAARALGFRSVVLGSRPQMVAALLRELWRDRHSAVLANGAQHSLWAAALRALLRGRGAQWHVVQDGSDGPRGLGAARLLARLGLRFVAASTFVRRRLEAQGVPWERMEVIADFLPAAPVAERELFTGAGLRRVVMLTALEHADRVDLLLDALERQGALRGLRFDIYGEGAEAAALRERARRHPNVNFHGARGDAAQALAQADLLLHTGPRDGAGRMVLQAFAAGVPVLVPNSGAAGDMVVPGRNGWHFTANDAAALSLRLQQLMGATAGELNAMAEGGRRTLRRELNAQRQGARWAALLGARPKATQPAPLLAAAPDTGAAG